MTDTAGSKHHTPGPWEVAGRLIINPAIPKNAGIVRSIAQCINEADAPLIAAAPETAAERDRLKELNAELLEALKLAESHLEEIRQDVKWHPIGHCPVLDRVRAVIAKAEGR